MVSNIMEAQGLPTFYEVFNDFVSVFKGFLFEKDTPRMFDQVSKFLDRKGH
jgi:hypothetical protein